MVKKKINVQQKWELRSLLFISKDGEDIHWNIYGAGNLYPTAEEFIEKYKLEAVDGKLMLVEKI